MGPMARSTLYCMDGAGNIGLSETIEAVDDQAAIEQAQALKVDALKCEVWQGRRLVAALDAKELAAA